MQSTFISWSNLTYFNKIIENKRIYILRASMKIFFVIDRKIFILRTNFYTFEFLITLKTGELCESAEFRNYRDF